MRKDARSPGAEAASIVATSTAAATQNHSSEMRAPTEDPPAAPLLRDSERLASGWPGCA